MKLTENFTISELIYSYTAQVNKIDNRPSVQVIENLKALCENILQPLRDHFACPIIITSGFRSPKLNKKIGGVANSQHIEGKAADFIIPAVDLKTVFKWIKNNLTNFYMNIILKMFGYMFLMTEVIIENRLLIIIKLKLKPPINYRGLFL